LFPFYVNQLHVPTHDHQDESSTDEGLPQQSIKIDVKAKAKIVKRSAQERFNDRYNETVPAESLRLRRVVHVVGPDDLPESSFQGPAIYGKRGNK
jgi:hypothetical protein